MTVYVWCFQWYEGAVVGCLGVILYCIVGGLGFNGMPGWAAGNVIIGLVLGVSIKLIKKINNKILQGVLIVIAVIVSTFLGIEIVKSVIDSFIVAQPIPVRMTKNFTSFVSDAFVIIVSIPICLTTEKYAKQLRYGK